MSCQDGPTQTLRPFFVPKSAISGKNHEFFGLLSDMANFLTKIAILSCSPQIEKIGQKLKTPNILFKAGRAQADQVYHRVHLPISDLHRALELYCRQQPTATITVKSSNICAYN